MQHTKKTVMVFHVNMKCNIQKDSYGVPCEHEMQYTKRH